MLSDMLDFCLQLLEGIAVWMGSEPMIYLFGIIIVLFVFRAIQGFLQ